MRVTRALGAALAAAWLASTAVAAPARPEAPTVLSEEKGVLRHGPTGIALPQTLAGIPRAASFPGNPVIVVYAPPGSKPDEPRRFAVAIGRAQAAADVERMRASSRQHAGGGKALQILFEGAFPWPRQSGARTFRGSYLAGGIHKQYWNAWAGGYGVTVMAEWPAGEPQQMDRIAAAIAGEVFGGAAPGR